MPMADCTAAMSYNGSMRGLVHGSRNSILFVLLLALAAATIPVRADQPSPRVKALLAQMLREEKMDIIRGAHEPDALFQAEAGRTPGHPRVGVPAVRFAHGPPR